MRTAVFAPVCLVEGDHKKRMVLLADHARRDLPDDYGSLGLPDAEFERHIAYDIGVEAVLRELACRLGAPAVFAGFSRLLIDPNRGEDDPTLIRQLYDGTIIPGNYPLDVDEKEHRLNLFYRPYHDAVSALIASVAQASGCAPLILSIHSFTPAMQGRSRPWHAGVLWDKDRRAAALLIDLLQNDSRLVVGDNEPYDGALKGDTMHRHATINGYAHALLEIRQDLIADAHGVASWVERLAPILETINSRPDMHVMKHHGSRTDPAS